ncbi:MAG: hypothetical protein JWQ90_4724 [Hydrocarboniphaga sp.]|nr:hypothetical protein [Hydrocarboniphaga sp.]
MLGFAALTPTYSTNVSTLQCVGWGERSEPQHRRGHTLASFALADVDIQHVALLLQTPGEDRSVDECGAAPVWIGA